MTFFDAFCNCEFITNTAGYPGLHVVFSTFFRSKLFLRGFTPNPLRFIIFTVMKRTRSTAKVEEEKAPANKKQKKIPLVDSTRISVINDAETDKKHVAYWMSRDQRVLGKAYVFAKIFLFY